MVQYELLKNNNDMAKETILKFDHGITYTHITDKFDGPNDVYGQKISYPLTANLNVTHDCNLECDYCIRQGARLQSPTSERMVTFLGNLPVGRPFRLTTTGGEPFVRKDIYEVIDFASRQPWAIGIISNGTIPVKFEKIPENTRFEFSIDAIDPSTYHEQRGGSEKQYQQIIKNIKEAKSKGFIVRTNVMLSRNNMDPAYIRRLINGFADMNIDQVRLQKFVIPRGAQIDDDLLKKYGLTDEEYSSISEVARNVGRERNIGVLVPQQNKQLSLGSVRIYPDGSVAVQSEDKPDQEIIGNIGSESLESCWSRVGENVSEMHLRYLIKPKRII